MAENRRGFLRMAALAGAAPPGEARQTPAQAGGAAPQRARFPYPRTFTGRHLAMIAFPLGGVAAGSVSLGGRGQLRDWEIFNRADKGRVVDYAFPSVWAQAGNSKPVARVLEARLLPPYASANGLNPNQVMGMPRLEGATFTGEYPFATIDFRDRKLPVKVSLEAFTPFIPLDPDDSGLPVAILRYRVRNPGRTPAKAAIAFSMDNPVGIDPRDAESSAAGKTRTSEFRTGAGMSGLFMTAPDVKEHSPLFGSFALALLHSGGGKVTSLRGWPRAKWWASPHLFWDDFSADGQLGPEPAERNTVGSLCLTREIPAAGEGEYTFLLAWHFPNRTPAWCGWRAPKGEEHAIIGNFYSRRFGDAWQAAEYAAEHLARLEKRTRQFVAAMRESALPAPVKDAAMANLSTLATETCFRTADGRFRGFEGIGDNTGLGHGDCTHVWNYETATQHLFPSLARSMREAGFELSARMDGVLPIRLDLPEGKQTAGITAADGTMGQIVKTYLDWKLSGDAAWLAKMWPLVKKAMEFAWVKGGWDGDRDGVAEGVQHNTYDVEFYGPNPMCGIYYLGGLRACEEMASAVGDAQFAAECAGLFARGRKWIDANLFNGQYYIQRVRAIPREEIAPALRSTWGAEDPEHPDFQLGEGCLADQLIGQYLADVAGLGPLVDPERIRKALVSIRTYNYRPDLYEHESMQRTYALNDEAAILICDYGKGKRPSVPFPYYAEAWTGIEYLYGSQLIFAGMVREGVQCFEDVRRRFDGERRNPWDEPEYGHHYARAMSAWSGVLALSGFEYHAARKAVTVLPRASDANFSSFWSTASGWGVFSRSGGQLTLKTLYGRLPCGSVQLAGTAAVEPAARLGTRALPHTVKRGANRVTFVFTPPVDVAEGDVLVLQA